MVKRKREVEESDELSESPEIEIKEVVPTFSKQKKNKNKKKANLSDVESDENFVPVSSKNKKMKQKKKSLETFEEKEDSSATESDENDEQMSPIHEKKKHKKKSFDKSGEKANSSKVEPNKNEELDPEQESDEETPKKSSSKASKSKGFVLFVGQIPHHITKKDIERHFTPIGGIKDVRPLIYQDSGRSRGCAYIEFTDNEHRKKAMKLNESVLGGGKIKVEYPYQGGKKYQGAKNNNKSKPKNRN